VEGVVLVRFGNLVPRRVSVWLQWWSSGDHGDVMVIVFMIRHHGNRDDKM
jgi:hypothetical protein